MVAKKRVVEAERSVKDQVKATTIKAIEAFLKSK